MVKTPMRALMCLLVSVSLLAAADGALELPTIFSKGMVIQRDQPVRVWGWGPAGVALRVELAGNTGEGVIGEDGRWNLELPALAAGGPYELVVSAGDETIRIADALVGEVWLCSGQSNMEFALDQTDGADELIAATNLPRLRHFRVEKAIGMVPRERCKGSWTSATRDDERWWTAVGFHFGQRLHQELDVPVGLVHASWGGTPLAAWTPETVAVINKRFEKDLRKSREDLGDDLAAGNEAREWVQDLRDEASRNNRYPYLARLPDTEGWESRELADEAWPTVELPAEWRTHGLRIDGAVWYRRAISIPESWAGRELQLTLGAIDDFDMTWFDGQQVGQTGYEVPQYWTHQRDYLVPAELVTAGEHVIAFRAFDHYGSGGPVGPAEAMRLAPADAAEDPGLSLAGQWRWQIELALPELQGTPRNLHREPAMLYNGMIHPVIRYAQRGAIWYQGESDSRRPGLYADLFPAMITAWRKAAEQPELAFLFVQLPNFGEAGGTPSGGGWVSVREAQTAALALPKTGMAVTIDVGDPDDIHPRNKAPVGERLAAQALSGIYGRDVPASGPVFENLEVTGREMRIVFTHATGLTTTDGAAPRAFFIAGEDQVFHAAEARIDGEQVVIQHPEVANPTAVRYAWVSNPEVNLVNGDGLPAAPFRSDEW